MSDSLKSLFFFLMLTPLVLLTACGGGGGSSSDSGPGNAPATSNAVQLDPPAYTLAANDRVKVTVFRHEDLSGEFELDGRGRFAMPLINEVNASGLTVRELEERIAGTYEQEQILVDAQVSVEILTYRPFFIIGEVARPGSYEYDAGMTVLNAIAQAGGFTPRARKDGFELQRGGNSARKVVVTGTTELAPGDTIEVLERWF